MFTYSLLKKEIRKEVSIVESGKPPLRSGTDLSIQVK